MASGSGYLVDAIQTGAINGTFQIDFVFLSVCKTDGEKSKVHLDWFTLSRMPFYYDIILFCVHFVGLFLFYLTEDVSEWRMSRHRRLACNAFPDYVAFEHDATCLTIRSTHSFMPLFDSANPNIKPLSDSPHLPATFLNMDVDKDSSSVRFTWTQSLPSMPEGDSTLLNILVKLADNVRVPDSKSSVSVSCKSCEIPNDCAENLSFYRLEINVHTEDGDLQLCSARLFAPVRPGDTMWTYDRETNR